MKKKMFLFFVMSIGVHNHCMDLVLPVEILQKMLPSFTLQTMARFGQTSSTNAKLLSLENKKNIKWHRSFIEEDYHLCTRALARFAQSKNVEIFEQLWRFDGGIRQENLE